VLLVCLSSLMPVPKHHEPVHPDPAMFL
jgi:hypothetical protein